MNTKGNLVPSFRHLAWMLGLALIASVAVRAGTFEVPPFRAIRALFATALVPNTLAKTRGCRDDSTHLTRLLPEWVSVQRGDTPRIAEGVVRKSHVATNDAPHSHLSHDQNFIVFLDPAYQDLNSDKNSVENGERLMEMEWEIKFFPPAFWPIPGDRVWMMGRWVFDCGHPDAYHTELHPPLAVAFTHLEPTTFPGDMQPTLTNRCSIYLHGRGGYYDQPVAIRDYEFDFPLPPRPSLLASVRAEVVGLPFGGPKPVLTVLAAANKVHVRYPLAAINDRSPDRKFGAVIAAGWQNSLAAVGGGPSFRVLRVTFESIQIKTDHDPDPPFINNSGEWHLWVRAGSRWLEVTGLGDVDNGDTVQINKSVLLTVPDSGAVPVGIQTVGWEDDCDGQFGPKIRNPSLGDLKCKANGNDDIGFIARDHPKARNFGIGSHNDPSRRNGDSDTLGDFNLRYRIEQVAVINPPTERAPSERAQ